MLSNGGLLCGFASAGTLANLVFQHSQASPVQSYTLVVPAQTVVNADEGDCSETISANLLRHPRNRTLVPQLKRPVRNPSAHVTVYYSDLVETRGIEPLLTRCKRDVIPLYHVPESRQVYSAEPHYVAE